MKLQQKLFYLPQNEFAAERKTPCRLAPVVLAVIRGGIPLWGGGGVGQVVVRGGEEKRKDRVTCSSVGTETMATYPSSMGHTDHRLEFGCFREANLNSQNWEHVFDPYEQHMD